MLTLAEYVANQEILINYLFLTYTHQVKLIFLYKWVSWATNIFKLAEYQFWDGRAKKKKDDNHHQASILQVKAACPFGLELNW